MNSTRDRPQSSPDNGLVLLSPIHNKTCMLCEKKEINVMKYGSLFKRDDIIVHLFCLYFTVRDGQSSHHSIGIFGFLLSIIQKHIIRGIDKTCTYCGRNGATIRCFEPSCSVQFHLPCGLQNGSMHQYYDPYRSFCQHHCIVQYVSSVELRRTTLEQCFICEKDVQRTTLLSSIWAPCCRHAWFHRNCVQNMAFSINTFKCPVCDNRKCFRERMLDFGIYIPKRVTSGHFWSSDCVDIPEPRLACHVPKCLCEHPYQRFFQDVSNSRYEIKLCDKCGNIGTHRLCSNILDITNWICIFCESDIQQVLARRSRLLGASGSSATLANTSSFTHSGSVQGQVNPQGIRSIDLLYNRPTCNCRIIINALINEASSSQININSQNNAMEALRNSGSVQEQVIPVRISNRIQLEIPHRNTSSEISDTIVIIDDSEANGSDDWGESNENFGFCEFHNLKMWHQIGEYYNAIDPEQLIDTSSSTSVQSDLPIHARRIRNSHQTNNISNEIIDLTDDLIDLTEDDDNA